MRPEEILLAGLEELGIRPDRAQTGLFMRYLDEIKKWNRVYSLPDHVFFSHAQHVKVGGIECAECHGAVEEMDIIQQFNDLSMGWCINCHRDTEVQFVDNEFYKKYEQLHEELKNGNREMISAEDIGGTECMKCHY